ncbi:MAG: hypothetical protein V1697_03470 [Candidatus Levyibacteriota bacterium]
MIKRKKAQKPKGMGFKKAQEEITGFAMIIIIVAVILVIFLRFALTSPQKDTIESYEVESYLQSLLQKTSDCKSTDNLRYYSVKELMFKCYSNETCLDGKRICDVFVKELGTVSNQSWDIGVGSSIRGYSVNATVNGARLQSLAYGNRTRSSKGASQELIKEGNMFNLEFKAYY